MRFLYLISLAFLTVPLFAQTAPRLDTEALDGTAVHLPDGRQPTLLVLGFSRKAAPGVMEWGRRLNHAEWNGKQAVLYEGAMLESVPKPLRGVVLRSIRKQVPAAAQGHFLPVTSDEKQWRALAAVDSEDDVYLLLLDAGGKLLWHSHGAYSDALLGEVTRQVLLPRAK